MQTRSEAQVPENWESDYRLENVHKISPWNSHKYVGETYGMEVKYFRMSVQLNALSILMELTSNQNWIIDQTLTFA